MRIVMLTPTHGERFGLERSLSLLSQTLSSRGHEVFTIAGETAARFQQDPRVVTIPGISSLNSLTHPIHAGRMLRRLETAIQEFQPDIVHAHDLFDFRVFRNLVGTYPTFLTAHTVSPSCPASTRFREPVGVCESKSGWGCVALHREQGCMSFVSDDVRRLHAIADFKLRRHFTRGIQSVFAISRFVAFYLLHDGWRQDQVVLCPNAIEPVLTEPTPSQNEARLLCASRLVPLKGIETLIEAMTLLPERLPDGRGVKLTVCGDGPLLPVLAARVEDLKLPAKVTLLGRVDSGSLQSELQQSNCFVQPNVGPEGFGLSVAEALAAGVPVVASKIPALDELVTAENGVLVPPGNPRALADAILSVLQDGDFAASVSKGRQVFTSAFSTDIQADTVFTAYDRALRAFA